MTIELPAVDASDLPAIQSILGDRLLEPAVPYAPHPGDLAWWLYHQDPRRAPLEILVAGGTFAVVDRSTPEVDVFGRGESDRVPILLGALDRIGGPAKVGFVSARDTELEAWLAANGYVPDDDDVSAAFIRPVAALDRTAPNGFEIRPLRGEEEAFSRRAASHAAFESTMDTAAHHARYLRFMRSPAYSAERDLVAVDADGMIVSFLVWWPDETSGVAQLEPVGTHPAYAGRGLGGAVFAFALDRMIEAGMHTVRVATDLKRTGAVAFYERLGFRRSEVIRWWNPA
jgi:GNAT superfamily N-acetyltransferase